MKTMGFLQFGLVRPSRLADPSHPMAQKMAVKSWDVLDSAAIFDNVDEAIVGATLVVGTTARRGVSGIISPKTLAAEVQNRSYGPGSIVILFGNEKSGLTNEELAKCDRIVRVPIAADQPSLNLAQAMQVITYELFASALQERESSSLEDPE